MIQINYLILLQVFSNRTIHQIGLNTVQECVSPIPSHLPVDNNLLCPLGIILIEELMLCG